VTGLSIGIIVPILPILVSTMQLTPSQFSIVVSSFAVSKLIGGIPSGSWADEYGRRRILVIGTAVCGVGIAAIGLTLNPVRSDVLFLFRCFMVRFR
jgi:MFS family permease